jgi:hypothetical protein
MRPLFKVNLGSLSLKINQFNLKINGERNVLLNFQFILVSLKDKKK